MGRRTSTAMMRIAIAGAGGFASLLAQELSRSAYAIIVLSTKEHPEFEASYDCQVAVVDYNILEDLQFTLEGVDLVISTISGAEQLNLIDAARRARVRCFVPSEFEGAIGRRPPTGTDPFDNDSSTALEQLRHWSQSRQHSMKYTVFSCGIFYERFAPGGLQAFNMGITCRIRNQGDYMIDVGQGIAEVPEATPQGHPIYIVMTSAIDVARFVAAAVELGIDTWPREFRMRGTRMTTRRLHEICSEVRGVEFDVITRPYDQIEQWLRYYEQSRDEAKWFSMQHLLQTANGRYTFGDTNLNDAVDVQPTNFRQWLYNTWGPA
ncbi:NAD(P)-binding protein [Annulohypoxylon maeteangense]|uniref:NAD(P)-binding protein n=1 Tax=Annulohypoxylon maeteangense TaxID=1927788 RepID=UPI002008B2D3|nr:NAD(P)-binding protein [Annulohypoxylon maeteangense]KAI0885669.1 NAD(P)-binding protein [Annulohypoxylon maeteangense]